MILKKLLLILNCLVITLAAVASNKSVNGIYYDFDKSSRQATVTYRGLTYDTYPNEYWGRITIPSTVVYGGIVYQVTAISEGAFRGCHSLRDVVIPKSVVSIGMFAFKETAMERDKSCWVDGIMYVSQCVVDALYDKVPEQVVLRSDTRLIADYAFAECENLEHIQLPDNLLSIGKMAFALCTALQEISIPKHVTRIQELTFFACLKLRKIVIPASVTTIEYGTFGGCRMLDSVIIESGNKNYIVEDGVIFTRDMTTLVAYPAGLKNTTYNVPNGVRQIGGWAFEAAERLNTVVLPNDLKFILVGAFTGCESLSQVVLPKSLDLIADDAFVRCFALKTLRIPATTKIAEHIGEPELNIVRVKK